MFSKLLIIASIGLVAANDEIFPAQDAVDATAIAGQKLELRVAAAGRAINVVSSGLNIAEKSIARVDDMADDAAALATSIVADNATLSMEMDKVKADLFAQLAATRAELDSRLKSQLQMIKGKVATQNVLIDTEVKGRFSNITDTLAAIIDAQKPAVDFIKSTTDCTKDGLFINPDGTACVVPDPGDYGHFAKVTHHGFEPDDGNDCGYLNYRTMMFSKKYEESYIRVFYYDNLRTYGHTANGRWNVMFCDASGNDCAHCETPGRIQNWRYSSHQSNWWMNDHMDERTMGLCKKSENRELVKGDYAIRVMIDDCNYDMYTGHNSYGSFMVDEVMAY